MKHSCSKQKGFSLVELLPAMVVLTLLGFVIAQVTGAMSKTTRFSNQLVDTVSQARLVFGCLGRDMAELVKRVDVPFEAQNEALGASNLLRFFSRVPSSDGLLGGASNRKMSVVAYQVASSADNGKRPCLLRAGKAVSWNTPGYFGLDAKGLPLFFESAAFPSALLPQGSDFDVLAPGVIRLVVGFELYPDNQAITLLDGTALSNARGQLVYSPPIRRMTPYGGGTSVAVIDLSRISALVVGIVVVDLKSLLSLDAIQVTTLAGAFGIPSAGVFPVGFWGALAASPEALPRSVPLPARQSLRVFQQCYPITPFASRQ